MGWKQSLYENSNFESLQMRLRSLGEEILQKRNGVITHVRDNAAYFAKGNGEPRVLEDYRNHIVGQFWTNWESNRGQPGVPTNKEGREAAIAMHLSQSAEWQRLNRLCEDTIAQRDLMEAEAEDLKRKYAETMQAMRLLVSALGSEEDFV
jgi:hypothetical protein